MKNAIILFIALLSVNVILGQSKKWNFGLQFSPEINFMHITGDSELGRFSVRSKPGFSAGLIARRNISNRFSFETGLVYREKNYRSIVSNVLLSNGISPQGELTYTSIHDKIQLGIISIPLETRVKFGQTFSLHGGVSLDLPFVQMRDRYVRNGFGESFFENEDCDLIARFMSVNIGMTKSIAIRSFQVELGPTLNYSRHAMEIPFSRDSERQLSAGFQLSILY